MFLHVEKSYLRHIRLIRLIVSKVRIVELTIFFPKYYTSTHDQTSKF